MLLTPLLPARSLQVPINHLINQTTFQPESEENLNSSNNSTDGIKFYHSLNNKFRPSPTASVINLISNQFGKTSPKLSVNDMLINASEIDNLSLTQRIKKNNSNNSNSSYIPYSNNSTTTGGFNNITNINFFTYNNYSAILDSDQYNKKQRSDLYLVRTNLEKNISYEKSNSNSAAAVNSKVIDATSSDGKRLQITFYDILFAAIVLSLIGVLILSLIGVVRCLRATRDSSGALALPTTLLSEDRTPLNTETNNTVPMLSVQSPGCAGMERLGIPARSSYGSPSVRDNRGHSCRLRSESTVLHSCDISAIPSTRQKMKSYQDINHHHGNIEVISCPHHVALADGEWGPDRDLQIRTPYQQTEITRTYIKAPPNKTAFDIPEQSYNLFSSTSSCNLNSHRSLNSINLSSNTSSSNISISPATSAAAAASAAATTAGTTNQKSKANAITKFLLRISSNSKSADNQSSQQQNATINHQQHHNHHHHYHHHQQNQNHHQQQHYQHYHIKNNSNSSLNNTSINSVVVVQQPQPQPQPQQQQQQQHQQQGFGSTNQNLSNNINNNNNNNHSNIHNNNNSDTNSNNSYSHQQTDS